MKPLGDMHMVLQKASGTYLTPFGFVRLTKHQTHRGNPTRALSYQAYNHRGNRVGEGYIDLAGRRFVRYSDAQGQLGPWQGQ